MASPYDFENTIAALAARFVNNTGRHIFLTGKAGTGKTTFLKYITEHTHKNTIVAAPTGIAAINAGGVTLHSLFQLPFGAFMPEPGFFQNYLGNTRVNTPQSLLKDLRLNTDKIKLLRELELVIIDEVSMLRADLLDAIDTVLRSVRKKNQLPFGGLQILFIGDLLQLPPVVKEDEKQYLSRVYPSLYFFDALALRRHKPVYIEFEKIYRQQDDVFINILNHLRTNEVTIEDIETLNSHYRPGFRPGLSDGNIYLTTHNYKADTINREALKSLPGEPVFYQADIEGEFSEHTYPMEARLELKMNAQVMFIKNDPSGEKRFYNGKIGKISALDEETIEVTLDDNPQPVKVEKYKWENTRYRLNETTNEVEQEVAGSFSQYPVKPAWAITVHKSQGLTFSKATIDIGQAFAPGQVYVALSRLTSLDGLTLTSKIPERGLDPDEMILDFAEEKMQEDSLIKSLDYDANHYIRDYLLRGFDMAELEMEIRNHVSGYNKDEQKSAKQKHQDWAKDFQVKFEAIKTVADKFLGQVNRIFESDEREIQDVVKSRAIAARDYFIPALKELSSAIHAHKDQVRVEKKIRKYLKQLSDLDGHVFRQVQRISRAAAMAMQAGTGALYSKETINSRQENDEWLQKAEERFVPSTWKPAAGKAEGADTEVQSPHKVSSRDISYELFLTGKSIEEIAHARDMAAGTIEGHLAYFVGTGMIDAGRFVSEDKRALIMAAAGAMEKPLYGAIKQQLGDEVSYSEIRFTLAGYAKKTEQDKP